MAEAAGDVNLRSEPGISSGLSSRHCAASLVGTLGREKARIQENHGDARLDGDAAGSGHPDDQGRLAHGIKSCGTGTGFVAG